MSEEKENNQAARLHKVHRGGLACAAAILQASKPRSKDIRVEEVSAAYHYFKYRVPIKFGGVVTKSHSWT